MMRLQAGTRVRKINSDNTDMHPDGAEGTVTLCIGASDKDFTASDGTVVPAGTAAYFVMWDDFPFAPVAITGNRIEPICSSTLQ